MKKLKKFWPLLILVIFPLTYVPIKVKKPKICTDRPSVSYTLNGGRLGDNLLSYLHAKWIAEKEGYNFYFEPFDYSDKFAFHTNEMVKPKAKLYKEVVYRRPLKEITSKKPLLYLVNYFPEALEDRVGGAYSTFDVDWTDKAFLKVAKEMVTSREKLSLVPLKEGHFNLALHIRRGSGGDTPMEIVSRPLKFPPLSYYVEGILKVSRLIGNKPIYAYIFTDAKDPNALKKQLQNELGDLQVTLDCGSSDVLTDFFSMMAFDGIVRASSNLSFVAAKLGQMQVEIAPKHFTVANGSVTPVVDQLILNVNQEEAFRGSCAPSRAPVPRVKNTAKVSDVKAPTSKINQRANNVSDHLVEKPVPVKLEANPAIDRNQV
ncbi:MAG: hypothetical protein SP1CHLAM54_01590 [Chlamydiia bacterium]|nr:hypothetical protein [Chlamydiia bacterium]MCH9615077.1 hypothetical protein [Chlamydiia bacterium]MCH9628601.1 hypothetical protein [Chlamydiia bacterium]